jgi:hypothetical protein
MSIKQAMVEAYGEDVLKKHVQRLELYDMCDALTEAIQELKLRVKALESGNAKSDKPRVRVPAGKEHNAG